MFWYRVELDAAGKLIKSEKVGDAGARDGCPSVYYFRAVSLSCAEGLAFREYHRLRQQARRERYAKLGNCKCGRSRAGETQADSAFSTCPKCRALRKEDDARKAARVKGLPVAPIDKSARFQERRSDEKLELLKEVQDQFLRLSMGNFGKWLNARIAELEPKQAPKLRVVGNGRR